MSNHSCCCRQITAADPSYVFTYQDGMQPPMTMARIREAEDKHGVKTGYDTSIESSDPAVLKPIVAELMLKSFIKKGHPVSADGENVAVVHPDLRSCG